MRMKNLSLVFAILLFTCASVPAQQTPPAPATPSSPLAAPAPPSEPCAMAGVWTTRQRWTSRTPPGEPPRSRRTERKASPRSTRIGRRPGRADRKCRQATHLGCRCVACRHRRCAAAGLRRTDTSGRRRSQPSSARWLGMPASRERTSLSR